MLSIRGYSNGEYIIPLTDMKIPKNKKVIITVLDDEENYDSEKNVKIKAFQNICSKLKDLDEELTDEFDEILSQRVNIARELEI